MYFTLIGNKIDMENQREVSEEEANLLANENEMLYYETSALNEIHIKECFE